MEMSLIDDAKNLANATSDAYSADRYGKQWINCAALLLSAGFSEKQAEQQLRSKNMRWAADGAGIQTQQGFFIAFAAMVAKNCDQMKVEAEKWAIAG
jgi:hypothetical protein